jgi:hypothetical protein
MKEEILFEKLDVYVDILLDQIMHEGWREALAGLFKNPRVQAKLNSPGGRELFAKEVEKLHHLPHDQARLVVARQWAGSMI